MFWLVSGIVLGFALIGAGMAGSHFLSQTAEGVSTPFLQKCAAVSIGLGILIFFLAVLSPPILKHFGQW